MMAQDEQKKCDTDRLLRLAEVLAATGLSQSGMYREIAAGRFPYPVRLTVRTSAWPSSEIYAWIEARIGERNDRLDLRTD